MAALPDMQPEQGLARGLAQYDTCVERRDDACRAVARRGGKRVEITWPAPLLQAWLEFHHEGQKVFEDWVDFYEDETAAQLCAYLVYVAARFLDHPGRVAIVAQWPEVKQLQVSVDGAWVNVFD